MTDAATALIGELLAATAGAHGPRAIVRAIAETLGATLPIVRVELRDEGADPEPGSRRRGELRDDGAVVQDAARRRRELRDDGDVQSGGRRLATASAVAVLAADGAWHVLDDAAIVPGARVLAPGLAVVTSGVMPELTRGAAFRAALGQVVAAALRHAEVVQRIALVSRRAHAENRELRADLDRQGAPDGIVARSAAMRAAVTRADRVARHPTTVLLTGESGAGKEVIARAIHRRSPRGHRAMIHVDCGAIPEALVESELFGHERGAFTGAERAHAGAFERAQRSTLFLDEVGELPLAAQAKLLRAIQERTVRRVGGEVELAVDVRLVAATNRDLAAMVARGAFREDLYYRLDVFAIRVPPLRERAADLPALVAALGRELATRLGYAAPPPITRGTLERLAAHAWPGNVRELRNTLETALILGDGEALALPAEFAKRAPIAGDDARLAASIQTAIEAALRATNGRIYGASGAAARLGLPPATLQSKMKKLGISRAAFVAPP